MSYNNIYRFLLHKEGKMDGELNVGTQGQNPTAGSGAATPPTTPPPATAKASGGMSGHQSNRISSENQDPTILKVSSVVADNKEKMGAGNTDTLPNTDILPKADLTIIRERRASSPVTKEDIVTQAHVLAAERLARQWEASRADVKPFGDTTNPVYKMFETSTLGVSDQPFGFLKKGDKASAIMETFMWEAASKMGVQDQFAITRNLSNPRMSSGTNVPAPKMIDSHGKLVEQVPVSGSVQPAIEGESLGHYLVSQSNREIQKEEIIKANLTALCFGMFDAHIDNLRLDPSGNIKFFDNARSLPSGNGILSWNDKLIPSYRPGLLALPGAHETLSSEERQQIKAQITAFKEQLPRFAAYIRESPSLKELPKGWLNQEESLSAMRERLERMDAAIDNPKVQTLRDLTMTVIPESRFFFALELVLNTDEGEKASPKSVQYACAAIGSKPMDELLSKAQDKGIDLKKIQELSKQDISIETLTTELSKLPRDASKVSNETAKKAILKEYRAQAKVDMKDIAPKDIPILSWKSATGVLKDENFIIDEVYSSELPDLQSHQYSIRAVDDPYEKSNEVPMKAYYKSAEGVLVSKDIDYSSQPGKLLVDGKPVTPKELKGILRTASGTTTADPELQKETIPSTTSTTVSPVSKPVMAGRRPPTALKFNPGKK